MSYLVPFPRLSEHLPADRRGSSFHKTLWLRTDRGHAVQLGIKIPAQSMRAYHLGARGEEPTVRDMPRPFVVQSIQIRPEDRRKGAATRALNWELPLALEPLGFTHIVLQSVGNEHLHRAASRWPMWRAEGFSRENFIMTLRA